jgi:raffinose/stachyose/melibiose transport system substrate-binding protein
MLATKTKRSLFAVTAGLSVAALALTGCSGGGGTSADGKIEISYLTQNDDVNVAVGTALIDAFEAENPDITVKLDTQPAGTEGDNLMKTKLSTGEMSDVFFYNSGSLLQALNPDQTLVNLADEAWVADTTDDWKTVVSTDAGVYGAPFGTSFAGAVIYNKKVFADLGLEVPTDWASFLDVAQKVKDEGDGITPIEQTYGDTWTSQLFVLADFANVATADPSWAENYTANKAKYADEPALAGFKHLQEAYDAGLFNEDFPSATNVDGITALGAGEAAMYPMLSVSVLSTLTQNAPDQIADMGVFPLPADDAANSALTIWQPNGLYIPKTTEGDQLEAAKKFVAFANSDQGCEIQNVNFAAAGPYVTSACTLPSDAAPLVADIQTYFDSGKTSPALEFLSPIKGPNLENITVEVGSGISSADDGAASYDDDVKKQAQQLGLEGW